MKNTTAVIVAAIVTAAGLHLVVQFKEKGPSAEHWRIVLAAFLLLAFLLLMAEVWPDGARGLALLIGLTAFVMNGGKFAQLIVSLVD